MPEHLLVVTNPYSSHAQDRDKALHELSINPRQFIPSSLDSTEQLETIYDQATEHTKLLIWGGDGTAHMVGKALLSPLAQQMGLHETPMLPLKGGNACDIALSLNPHGSPSKILSHGHNAAVRPLEITINDDTSHAIGYFSIGGTAQAAAALNKLKTEKPGFIHLPRWYIEKQVAWQQTADYPTFTIATPDGSEHRATDTIFLNADRMAKLARTHASLFNDTFEPLIMRSRGRMHTLLQMGKMAVRMLHGEPLSETFTMTVTSDDESPLPIQRDGETDVVESGSQVTVRMSSQVLQMISGRP